MRDAPDQAEIHYQLAETLVCEARPEEAMHAYEAAYMRDRDGMLDRRGGIDCMEQLQFNAVPAFWQQALGYMFAFGMLQVTLVYQFPVLVERGFSNALAAAVGDEAFRRMPVQPDIILAALEAGHVAHEPLTANI